MLVLFRKAIPSSVLECTSCFHFSTRAFCVIVILCSINGTVNNVDSDYIRPLQLDTDKPHTSHRSRSSSLDPHSAVRCI